jgi:hypothetical protein
VSSRLLEFRDRRPPAWLADYGDHMRGTATWSAGATPEVQTQVATIRSADSVKDLASNIAPTDGNDRVVVFHLAHPGAHAMGAPSDANNAALIGRTRTSHWVVLRHTDRD